MHELALSHSIVEIAAECARREGLRRITRVVVEIGETAAVDPGGLEFCFGIVAADTLAQGAELSVERVALRAVCRECRAEFEPVHLASECPRCGAHGFSLLRGRELRVKSLDGE